jgi:hypothetical protein
MCCLLLCSACPMDVFSRKCYTEMLGCILIQKFNLSRVAVLHLPVAVCAGSKQ